MCTTESIDYTKEEIQQKYNKLAGLYKLSEPIQEYLLGTARLRRRHLQRAHGNVLEVAVGTGTNLPY